MCAIERGSFDVNTLSESDISVVANTSLEECSDVAVLVLVRVRVNDIMSTTTTMMTSIGENIVVNFTSSTDQYSCMLYIKLPSGRCLSFPSFNCSTGKEWHIISFYHYNNHLLNLTAWYCGYIVQLKREVYSVKLLLIASCLESLNQ